MDGKVIQRGDRFAVRFERILPHTMAKVWAALTTPAELEKWFAVTIVELRVGGRFHVRFEDGSTVDGEVRAVEPPRLLEVTWHEKGHDPSVLRWELFPHDDGTRFVLTHTLSAKDWSTGFLGGWHDHLDLLGAALAGTPIDRDSGRWQALEDEYRGLVPEIAAE
ncbi:MAG: SRPBCC family protein [Dehalococcoidia bacterium]